MFGWKEKIAEFPTEQNRQQGQMNNLGHINRINSLGKYETRNLGSFYVPPKILGFPNFSDFIISASKVVTINRADRVKSGNRSLWESKIVLLGSCVRRRLSFLLIASTSETR